MANSSVKNSKLVNGPTLSTQTYLRISEIREDTLVLKNGGLRAVMRVSSINFNLKSEEEQNAIIYSYQGFLNTLDGPIQIVVRSKKLDIDKYLDDLKEKGNKQTNALLQKQTFEYVEYIHKLVEFADIMSKEFYVIVPLDPFRSKNQNFLEKFFGFINAKDSYAQIKQRREEFDRLKKKLSQKVNSVKIGLENCNLKVEELTTKELIQLFYEINNPMAARYQKGENWDQSDIKTDEEMIVEDKAITKKDTKHKANKKVAKEKSDAKAKTMGNNSNEVSKEKSSK
jgi:peptide methionine sulfoxide reductase MsrA